MTEIIPVTLVDTLYSCPQEPSLTVILFEKPSGPGG